MEMIIGGAYQGKEAYARQNYPGIVWKNGAKISREELMSASGVLDFQEFIRKELKAGESVTDLAEKIIRNNPDVILVCQEVGYGVVPVDAFDREYREAVGRVCTELASFSRKVTRVTCGIGTVIKND